MLREKQVQRPVGACARHGPASSGKRWERRSAKPWDQATRALLRPAVRSLWIRPWHVLIVIFEKLKLLSRQQIRSGRGTEAEAGIQT